VTVALHGAVKGRPMAGSGARWQAGAWGAGRLAARQPILVARAQFSYAGLRCSPGGARQRSPSGLGGAEELMRKWRRRG
jgi:hypothetical protein